MDAKEVTTIADAEETSANTSQTVPIDIDLENRKNIIRKELDKIFTKTRKQIINEAKNKARFLEAIEKSNKRKRRRIANESKRRNRV